MNNKTNIIIGIEAFSLGEATGIGTYCTNLVLNLIKIDSTNQYFIFVKKKSLIKYPHNFKETVIKVFHPAMVPFLVFFYIPFVAKKNKIDVLHYTKGVSSIFKFCKIVTTIHDLIPVIYPESNKNIFHMMYWQFNLWLSVKKSDLLIADSKYTKKTIVNHYKINNEKIYTVYLGCDFKNFKKISLSDKNIDLIRIKYGLPESFILFVGNLRDSKNLKLVLKAVNKLKEEKRTIKLLIIGAKKWKNKDFDSVFNSLDIKELVYFIGKVEYNELPYFYDLAKVFVFPSLYEGFGLPILEAQACGCPVIASDRTSLPEVLDNKEVTIDPNDLNSFIKILLKLLNNGLFKIKTINEGLENAKRFKWEDTARNTKRIYERLL